jgi:transposase
LDCLPVGINLKDVIIGFQDEARIGQQGSMTKLWARKGTRPRAVRQKQFISTNIFGIVCPEIDTSFALILPEKNTEMMQLFLDEYSTEIPEGKHVVLIGDQAGWHKTPNLKKPKNISLIFLPPYSPELNPIEQLWRQLKHSWLANRCFKDYKDIVNATVHAWKSFCNVSGSVKKLCSRSWASLEV